MAVRMSLWAGLLGTLTILVPTVALACAVCFVEPGDRGSYVSVLFLMAMPYTLVGTIGGWVFLTGHKATIYRLAREGFKLSVEDASTDRPRPREPANAPRPAEPPGSPGATKWGADRSANLGGALRAALSPAVAWAHHGESQGPIHSARFVLVDRQGRIRGYFASDEAEALQQLRQAIARLLQER